jgi:hypothetical protein
VDAKEELEANFAMSTGTVELEPAMEVYRGPSETPAR